MNPEFGIIRAPWTQKQVDDLNQMQQSGTVHPYTCGGERTDKDHIDGQGILVATVNGWVCPYCDYKQNWSVDPCHVNAERGLEHMTPDIPLPSKYHRRLPGTSVAIDVYDVLLLFGVHCPARQHAIKKLLCAGQRGSKSAIQDLQEAADSIKRSIQIEEHARGD